MRGFSCLADVECIVAVADSKVSATLPRQTADPAQLEFDSLFLRFTDLILQWEGSSCYIAQAIW